MSAAEPEPQRITTRGISTLTVRYQKRTKAQGGPVTTITADCTGYPFDNERLKTFADNVRRFADTDVWLQMEASNGMPFVVKLEGDTLHAGQSMYDAHREISWPELVAAIRQIVPEWE